MAGEIGAGQFRPRPQHDAQPPRHHHRVRLRHRGRVHGVLCPAGRRVPAGQIGEEIHHQLRHLLSREQTTSLVGLTGEPAGDIGRDQVLHHRPVNEGEPAIGIPAQRRPRTEQMRGLGRGQTTRVPHRPEHPGGDLVQPGHRDERLAVPPHRHRQLGDSILPLIDRQLR